jgi:hypothetical protein
MLPFNDSLPCKNWNHQYIDWFRRVLIIDQHHLWYVTRASPHVTHDSRNTTSRHCWLPPGCLKVMNFSRRSFSALLRFSVMHEKTPRVRHIEECIRSFINSTPSGLASGCQVLDSGGSRMYKEEHMHQRGFIQVPSISSTSPTLPRTRYEVRHDYHSRCCCRLFRHPCFCSHQTFGRLGPQDY